MFKILISLALSLFVLFPATAQTYSLVSPNGSIVIDINCGKRLSYSIKSNDESIIESSPLAMKFADGTVWGEMTKVIKTNKTSVNKKIDSPLYKKSSVDDNYNELKITFKGDYGVIFRAYDDGAAYRFVSLSDKKRVVLNEVAEFCFGGDYGAIVPYVLNRSKEPLTLSQQFKTSFESTYDHLNLSNIDAQRLIFTPAIVTMPSGRRVCIAESDLESYPGMFLNNPDGKHRLKGIFAPYPKTTELGGHSMIQKLVTQTEEYIATIEGKRNLPWRTIIIASNDFELLNSDMVYRLASDNRLEEIDWIKPGRVAWEWWNDWGVFGVDFKTGLNTQTYKHYIDFAAEYGLEYIILDEGWSVKDSIDLFKVVPEVDIKQIADYGKTKGVGVILWAGYAPFDNDLEAVCAHYSKIGVAGFKVDFMDRDDQQMVDFVYRAAETAAKHKMILDLHGMYKPTGLQRTYPNLINFEGVFGMERTKWTSIQEADMVVYDVTVPFIRQVAGPMDYTQGAMLNSNRETFRPQNSEPMSQGTRCRQLAEYIIFESPLTMLCDSPNKYRNEQGCTKFIASIPTVWEQTVALDGKIGEYAALARRRADKWYVGAMTDWNQREITIDLSMLENGRYSVELFRDGINADRYAQDYTREVFELAQDKKITVTMMPGGGFAAIITPIK